MVLEQQCRGHYSPLPPLSRQEFLWGDQIVVRVSLY